VTVQRATEPGIRAMEVGRPDARSRVLEAIAAMWREVLELPDAPDDLDFLDAGGDSLRATRVISRIYRDFRVELTFDDFFDASTPRGLAALVAGRLPTSTDEHA
jgi:acyl carrier protein